jgi:oligoribonuclease
MDRRFLATYLNDIEEFLHYRSVDVSTIKELARRWHPMSLSAAPRKEAGHRALDDITESVNELRYYRRAVFLPTPSEQAEAGSPGGSDEGDAEPSAEGGAGSDTAAQPTS